MGKCLWAALTEEGREEYRGERVRRDELKIMFETLFYVY